MSLPHRIRALPFLVVCLTSSAAAQSAADRVATGDSLSRLLSPAEALREYELAVALDSSSSLARWKAAGASIDVAKQLTSDRDQARRDRLYAVAQRHAEAAIALDSLDADAHFMLAQALGRLSLTKSGKARVRYGRRIYDEAARALALDSTHDGAHHVLGAWHAEVERLSGLTRTFAKLFLGGGFLGRADWDSATAHLEQAVQLRPGYVFHRLELAQIYLDRRRDAAAQDQLERILTLPNTDVLDWANKEEAMRLLSRLRERQSRR